MQLKAVSILCVLLCGQVFALRDVSRLASRSLKQGGSTSGGFSISASSDADSSAGVGATFGIILVGDGVVTAFAVATAIAVADAFNDFNETIAKSIVIVKTGGNATAIAKANVSSFAFAFAKTFAETAVSIQSTGEGGTACVRAISDAQAAASATAKALVNVLAEASNDISFASASVAVDAIINVTASSFASAQTMACGSGVFNATTFIEVLSTAIARPFIEVVAMALALVAPGVAVAKINVAVDAGILMVATVDGRTASEVFGESTAASSGTAGASTTSGR